MRKAVQIAGWVLGLSGLLWAQAARPGQSGPPNAPAATPQAPQASPAPAPQGKLPPQAKTQDEYKAYQDATQTSDALAAEKAAQDFAAKFKTSELQYLLYYRAMTLYQNQNNADKAIEMGRKVLEVNPNEPITLAMVANFIAERTRDTDLNRDQQLSEALLDAQKSLEKIDTDLIVAPNTPPDKLEANKALLRSIAYGAIGNVYLSKGNYAEAEANLKRSIELNTVQPDAVTWLRYAVVLDHLNKYQEALLAANKALELSPEGSPQAGMAKQEKERLLKLTGGPQSPRPAAQQPQGAAPAPR
jgi:tetratricopeptide (TPR) repeat protein